MKTENFLELYTKFSNEISRYNSSQIKALRNLTDEEIEIILRNNHWGCALEFMIDASPELDDETKRTVCRYIGDPEDGRMSRAIVDFCKPFYEQFRKLGKTKYLELIKMISKCEDYSIAEAVNIIASSVADDGDLIFNLSQEVLLANNFICAHYGALLASGLLNVQKKLNIDSETLLSCVKDVCHAKGPDQAITANSTASLEEVIKRGKLLSVVKLISQANEPYQVEYASRVAKFAIKYADIIDFDRILEEATMVEDDELVALPEFDFNKISEANPSAIKDMGLLFEKEVEINFWNLLDSNPDAAMAWLNKWSIRVSELTPGLMIRVRQSDVHGKTR